MPNKSPRPCNYPGCPEKVRNTSFCPKHQRKKNKEYDQARPSASGRGYGTRHRKWRKIILARDPLCEECLSQGLVVPSVVADHIIPLSEGGDWSLKNGQGLCISCHNRKTMKEHRARGRQEG